MIYGIVKGQHLTLKAYAVADTIDYLTASFSFVSADWDGLTVYAHFTKGNETHSVELVDGKITESDHLNLSEGEWGVYLHGNEYNNGDVLKRITTNIEKFNVEPTGTLDGDPFPEVEASIVEQFAAELDEMDERISGLENAVEDVVDAEGNSLVTDKVAHLPEIPAKTSDLNNDSGFITNAVNDLVNYYTKAEVDVKGGIELYDSATGKPKYSVTEIDEMYADGKLMTWKGRFVLAVYANTQWNRFLYFPRESASRQVLVYKQSVQNGSVVGDEEQIGGFSDINFTLAHFNKLQGIETGAQKNVQTDYTEADSSKDSFLKNKPTKLSDFTNDVGYLTETTYTEIYDTANSQSFYTGTEIKTMFANNIPLVYTLANGIKYFVYAVEGSSTITLQLWTVVNSVGGSTGWAGKATIPASTKAISDVTIYTKTVLSSDISKFTGGSVSQGNTSFVSGGQVYDALQGGASALTDDEMITLLSSLSDILIDNGDYLGDTEALAF